MGETIGEFGRDASKRRPGLSSAWSGPDEAVGGAWRLRGAGRGGAAPQPVRHRPRRRRPGAARHRGRRAPARDPPGTRAAATISLSVNFIGPVRPGLVLAIAEIQRIGGSVAYTSMALHAGDFDGELLATAHGAYRLFHATGRNSSERVDDVQDQDLRPRSCRIQLLVRPRSRRRRAGLSRMPGSARGC